MAFHDGLARNPKNEDEFWSIIEETFQQAEGSLTFYAIETPEEALSGTLRLQDGNESFRGSPGDFIRYRGVDKDYDSRDYFLTLGRKFLPRVERQIKSRRLTPKFTKDWGVVMLCHGFISAHILDDSDGLSHQRAGLKSAKKRNKDPQRKWLAHLLLREIDSGFKRKEAEGRVERLIARIIERGVFPTGFDAGWFEPILRDGGALSQTYSQRHLPLNLTVS